MNAEPALTERAKLLTPTYGGYIAYLIRTMLQRAAEEFPSRDRAIVPGVTVCELGSSVYAITCSDFNGQEYRITVELATPRTGEGEAG